MHPYRLARHQGSLYLIGLKVREAEVRTWHPSQQITDHRDGSLTIEFLVFETVELKSWILSFGQDAEVLEGRRPAHRWSA